MMDDALSVFSAAREAGSQLAVVTEDRELTYAELAERVRGALSVFEDLGLERGCRVALHARADLDTVVAVHALLAVGVPFVPVHPKLTADEASSLLARSGATHVIEPAELAVRGDNACSRTPSTIEPSAPLALLFTSGTSGRSKLAVLSRRAFLASARASESNLGWRPHDRWLLALPPAHVGGLSVVVRTLVARRCLAVVSGSFDPDRLAREIDALAATIVSLVPTQLSRLLRVGWKPSPTVRAVLLGGAAAAPSLLVRAADLDVPVLTTYGLTEACSQVSTQPYGMVNRGELGSGRPLPGIDVCIRDEVIHVRSDVLFDGYEEDGRLVRPFDDDGWFATGDLGRFDEHGFLHVFARRTDLIVTGGENVYPAEVERCLEELPFVDAACVFGVEDEEWGQIVGAAVVLSTPVERERIDAALRARFASHTRPRVVAVVDALPLTSIGKVDRERCRQRYGNPQRRSDA